MIFEVIVDKSENSWNQLCADVYVRCKCDL